MNDSENPCSVTWPDIFRDTSLIATRHKMVLIGELLQAWTHVSDGYMRPKTFNEVMDKSCVHLGFFVSPERLNQEGDKLLATFGYPASEA